MPLVQCPDAAHMEAPHQGPLYVVGCGARFEGVPDSDGDLDCPECGMWFTATKPSL